MDVVEARRTAARLVCFGFDGTEMNDHARRLIDAGAGAVIIFARNIRDPAQVATLCAEMKRRAAPRPLLVMIDQEGGRVARFRGPHYTDVPSAERVGRSRDPARAASVAGDIIGRELRACHVDMDLAPVVDVHTNPANTVIGDRAFGTDPSAVATAAAAFITALQARGVAACAKHWPGHGDTVEDSHDALPSLPHDLRRLRDVEMRPFRDAIAANVASVLVAHLLVPAMEPPGARPVPASASAAVIRALRRDEGFDRLVMTDDMEMGAMRAFGLGDAAVRGLAAGVDMFLVCHTESAQTEVLDALTAALAEGKISRAAAEAATRRVDDACDAFVEPAPPGHGPVPDPSAEVGTEKHKRRLAEATQSRL